MFLLTPVDDMRPTSFYFVYLHSLSGIRFVENLRRYFLVKDQSMFQCITPHQKASLQSGINPLQRHEDYNIRQLNLRLPMTPLSLVRNNCLVISSVLRTAIALAILLIHLLLIILH